MERLIRGLPWDSMCFCGQPEDLGKFAYAKTDESYAHILLPVMRRKGEKHRACSMPCYGKPSELCGAKLITRALKSSGTPRKSHTWP